MVSLRAWRGVIEEHREFLDVERDMPVITLLEGKTPLLPAGNLAQRLDVDIKIYFKFEGLNPTGSFKDRGMTLAVSKALQDGAKVVVCASTGNTAASAAAYAARAGLRCVVVLPHGAIATGKLAQARVHGAQIVSIRGNFDAALAIVREMASRSDIALVNSVNPWRIEGQKTAAFEIVDELGDAPDWLVIPVGNAGNITAYWRGFSQYYKRGIVPRRPRMVGYQAAGVIKMARLGKFEAGQSIVAVLTGHGLKDPESAMRSDAEILAGCSPNGESQGLKGIVVVDDYAESIRRLLGI